MKLLIYITLFLAPAFCQADTYPLKDGARLEGDVTGEMEGVVLVQTKYGSLTIKRADILEQKAAPAAAPAPAVTVSTEAAPLPVSTAAVVAVSTAITPAAEPPAPKFTFATVLPSTSTRLLVYSENGVAIATETLNAAGGRLSLEGAVKDGAYTEYYDNGGLKTVKTVTNGRAGGTLKAFYPSGAVQIEAYYLAGAKDGPFKYYDEDGKLLMEASYKNDKLDGWKREYDDTGAVKAASYYTDDHLAEPPKPQSAPASEKTQDSQVTAKITILARGEKITFRLNGKFIGATRLDRDLNIIEQEGKIPDGSVKVYSAEGIFSRNYGSTVSGVETFNWAGKLARELTFNKNEVILLRTFNINGEVDAEYTFKNWKAFKK
jgi:antitoxin component YwqK of YwqJK toxin-antitoxin module